MHNFIRLIVIFFVLLIFLPINVVAEEKKPTGPNVKMSNARVCYERDASIFGEITAFKPFNSMEECVKAGGRDASGGKTPSEDEAKSEGEAGDTKEQGASKEKAQENRMPQQL